MENIALIESFSEFKDDKFIDRVTLMAILEEVFRSALKKKFGSDDNFDIIINPDKGDLEIWRNRVVVEDGAVEDPNEEISLTEARKIEPDFEIGEDVSDQSEVKIIFDGYGDLEDEDENGEYRYTEGGNKNMESYAIFIHKDSAQEDFVFPEHELTPWCLIHRPKEEVCIYAWYDVENDNWDILPLEERVEDTDLTVEQVMGILETLNERYF